MVDTTEGEETISTRRSIKFAGGAATQSPRSQKTPGTVSTCKNIEADRRGSPISLFIADQS